MSAAFLSKKSSEGSSYASGDCGGSCGHGCCGSKGKCKSKHGAMGISKPQGVPSAHGAAEDDEEEESQMQMLPPEGGPSHKLHGKKGGEKKMPLNQSPAAGAAVDLAKKGIKDPKVVGISKLLDAKKAVAKAVASESKKESRKDEKDSKTSKKASK